MLVIENDEVGQHDFLLSPCSKEMFAKLYGHETPHQGCFGNLVEALETFGIGPDGIPTAFNVFMNVRVNSETGALSVEPPLSKAGDSTTFVAQMDLVVELTACSAGLSNNFRFKPVAYRVE